MRENVVLADCQSEELALFVKGLNKSGGDFIIKSHVANWKRTGKIIEIKRYFMYFFISLKYFANRKSYGTIFGWQQFYVLIFCFYCAVFRVKKSCTVIALNYTYKEKDGRVLSNIYRWFMRKCVCSGYLDFIHVPSASYADELSQNFDFPRNRIIVTAFGVNDMYEKYRDSCPQEGYEKEKYMLAIGRSNRDFDFLLRAWEEIDYKLVIISDTYAGHTDNFNVSIRRDIAGKAQYPWIMNSKAVIIPIDDGRICSGDTVLLTGMSFERIMLVTKPSTLAEMYIDDGINGLTVKKEITTFKCKIEAIISGKYNNLGKMARQSFLDHFSREYMGIAISEAIRGDTL